MFSKISTIDSGILDSIIQDFDHCICIVNTKYQLIDGNQAFLSNFPNNGLGLDFLSNNKQFKESLEQAFKGAKIQYITKLNNRIFEIKISIQVVENESLALVQFFPKSSQTFDSEQALQYKYIVDHVHDVLFQTDASGNWVFLNQAWTNIFDYTLEESLGRPFYEFLHPEDVQKNALLFAPLIAQQKIYCKHIIRYISKAGSVKWIEVFATLVIDKLGAVTGTAGTLRDITNEKEKTRINSILSSNVQDIVCIHDLEGNYLYVSPSISLLTLYSPEELLGKSHYDFVHPDDRGRFMAIEGANHETSYISYRFKKKNGEYIWLETSLKVFFDDYDICSRIITSSRSIQERKLVEESMLKSLQREKELNQLKTRFVNMTSHEFRTPLATIRSSAEIIEAYTKIADFQQKDKILKQLINIQSEISRISNLINETLLIGKMESQQLTVHREEVDVVEQAQFVISRQNQQQKDFREAKLIVLGKQYKIWIDPQHLIHILDNLLTNAFKYSEGKPEPIILIRFEKCQLSIEVKDFGMGIPYEEQHKIYSSFFRANNVSKIEGTGLGLVIVKNLVQLNEGNIRFESVENQGTTFFIDF